MASPAVFREVERNLLFFRKLWRSNLLSSFVQPLLYLAAMGIGVGALVKANANSDVLGGVSYAAFIAPGLLTATTLSIAANESMWPLIDALVWGRHWQSMAATPLRSPDLTIGHGLWIGFRCLISAVAVVLAMQLFPDVRSPGLFVAIIPAVLCGLAMGMPIAAWTVTREVDMSFVIINRFIIMPLTLFAGTFYPVSQLPLVARWLAYISPLWHGTELARAASTTMTISTERIAVHLCYLIVAALGGWWLMNRNTHRRLFA